MTRYTTINNAFEFLRKNLMSGGVSHLIQNIFLKKCHFYWRFSNETIFIVERSSLYGDFVPFNNEKQ